MHPGVEPPVLLHRTVGYRLYLLVLRSVCDHDRRLAALPSYLFHQRVEPWLAPGRDHHLGAPLCEPEGGLPPYAAGGAHQRHHLPSIGLSCAITTPCAFRPSYESVGLSSSGKPASSSPAQSS